MAAIGLLETLREGFSGELLAPGQPRVNARRK